MRQPAPTGERQAIGPALSQTRWIPAGDRGADRFRLFQAIQLQGGDVLIRAVQNRCVQVGRAEEEDQDITRVFHLAQSVPAQSRRMKDLPRLPDRPARHAFVLVHWSQIQPRRGEPCIRKRRMPGWCGCRRRSSGVGLPHPGFCAKRSTGVAMRGPGDDAHRCFHTAECGI